MALLSQDAPDLMKSRLEQGVWLDQIERSYNAWFAAPNHKKPELLLAGPTLTWAESWMLTQPKELSASLKQYIIRSLTAQSRKSAGQREVVEAEQRRKDSVYRYLLITMALFALMVLAPGAIRDFLGFQFEHSLPVDPDASGQVASDETMRPDGPREPQIADAAEPTEKVPAVAEAPSCTAIYGILNNPLESPVIHYRLTAESGEAKNRVSRQTFTDGVKPEANAGMRPVGRGARKRRPRCDRLDRFDPQARRPGAPPETVSASSSRPGGRPDRGPSAWPDPNAPWRSSGRPSDSLSPDPISPGIPRGSCCIWCAGDASAI